MSELKQPSRPLPADDSVIIKMLWNEETIYQNTKDYVSGLTTQILSFFSHVYNGQLIKQGVKVELLEPGKNWVIGHIRLRWTLEFIPDEPKNSKTSGEYLSPLDDIRNINL
jgi:hypothetical protein